jgi:hypothetical protein
VGQTQIANAERVPGEPQTLQIAGMPEAAALELVLRSAGGYVAIDRDAARWAPAMSRYSRIVIAPSATQAGPTPPSAVTAAASATMGAPAAAPVPATVSDPGFAGTPSVALTATGAFAGAAAQAVPDSIETAPGVRRLIGPDGLPVPDDQEDAPPPTPASPRQRGRGGAHEH